MEGPHRGDRPQAGGTLSGPQVHVQPACRTDTVLLSSVPLLRAACQGVAEGEA
jgi:hypothetical protein